MFLEEPRILAIFLRKLIHMIDCPLVWPFEAYSYLSPSGGGNLGILWISQKPSVSPITTVPINVFIST